MKSDTLVSTKQKKSIETKIRGLSKNATLNSETTLKLETLSETLKLNETSNSETSIRFSEFQSEFRAGLQSFRV